MVKLSVFIFKSNIFQYSFQDFILKDLNKENKNEYLSSLTKKLISICTCIRKLYLHVYITGTGAISHQ